MSIRSLTILLDILQLVLVLNVIAVLFGEYFAQESASGYLRDLDYMLIPVLLAVLLTRKVRKKRLADPSYVETES